MKPHILLKFLAILLIGFFIGRVTSLSSGSQRNLDDAAEAAPGRTRVAERGSNPVPNTQFARLRKEIRSAPADQCGQLLRQALQTPDPFERRALLDELYARMDASNFLEMSLAPARISLETGRDHHDEWLLVHARVGQVAGPQAMARWIEQRALGTQPAERTLWGWATQDPEAARKWLDDQPDLSESLRKQLLSTIMTGAIVNDPVHAIALLGSLPDADRVKKADAFVGAFVQQLGKDRAIEWLTAVNATEPESDYGKSLTRSIFDKTMWAGANQTNAKVMVADMERLASVMTLDESWINRGMGQIRDRKITGGIELLDQISRSPTLNRIPLGESVWASAVGRALKSNPAAVAEWLAKNPDSPIRPVVSSMVEKGN